MKKQFSKKTLLISGAIGLLFLGLGAWLLHLITQSAQVAADVPMQKALARVPSIHSYTQYVETQTKVDDRRLQIVGVYSVDTEQKQYASYSTTTLFIGSDPRAHTFVHQNIAIGDDVYLKIETADPALQASIQTTKSWQSFKSNAIPKNFTSIAIAGPLQDNIEVLGKNGAYLVPVASFGAVQWGAESLLRYTFRLSQKAFAVSDGPLNSLVLRVGHTGTVDVWIDPKNFAVRYLVFANVPYLSTTTITNINALLPLAPPIAAKS